MNPDEGYFKKGFKLGCGGAAASLVASLTALVGFVVIMVLILLLGTCYVILDKRNDNTPASGVTPTPQTRPYKTPRK